jgi:hypothetical protein
MEQKPVMVSSDDFYPLSTAKLPTEKKGREPAPGRCDYEHHEGGPGPLC